MSSAAAVAPDLCPLVLGASPAPATAIVLHGLGADANDLAPLAAELAPLAGGRFVLPNAPIRAVTINGGAKMRAWHDIGPDFDLTVDPPGASESLAALRALLRAEIARGIDSRKIALIGFSQGGAMALALGAGFDLPLGAVVALSGYELPGLAASPAAAAKQTPFYLAHGEYDSIVPPALSLSAQQTLRRAGFAATRETFAIDHSLAREEIDSVNRFLVEAGFSRCRRACRRIVFFLIFCRAWVIIRFARGGRLAFALFFAPRGKAFMVRRVMKDAFVVWKNSRSIFGLTNYFAGQPRVAGAILSILFGLFLSACGGGSGSSPTVTPPPPLVVIDPITLSPPLVVTCAPDCPIFVDAPVQGLHYRPVGPTMDISISQKTGDVEFNEDDLSGFDEDDLGGFDPSGYGTVAFAVGEITVDGDGLTLSQYKSNGFLGFIVHPAEDWINTVSPVVFTPYDLRDAGGNTVNVGAVARVLQGFDRIPPSTSSVGINVDNNLILIHLGATAGRTVTIDRLSPAGEFSVQELDETGIVRTDIVEDEDNYTVVISMALKTENSPGYGGATLRFPLHSNAMRTLSMVIADMADEIARFPNNSKKITLNSRNAPNPYFARRGAYSLIPGGSGATIDPDTGSLTYKPTEGVSPANVSVVFQYADQISINQAVELDSLPRTDSKDFQIYFTGGKYVALTLDETTGGNLPLSYELTIETLSELKRYNLIFDHENGVLFGTPQQEAFTVSVALDIFDSGRDDAKPLVPDLEFQIVSREGAPAYYEIDLTGGAGSTATLIFSNQDGNIPSRDPTEKSIAGIDSNCQDGVEPNIVTDFPDPYCPYSAKYTFGGARHPEGLGDIPEVTVVLGLKSKESSGVSVCARPPDEKGVCPAGVRMFTVFFQNENDNEMLSVTVRVLLPRPEFDPAFASENFATYIAGSPNPSRRPLPAADGGNGRLIYSVASLPPGLTLHSATRRLLGRPTVIVLDDTSFSLTMTVADSNGNGDSTVYSFAVVVQPDRKPAFEDARGMTLTAITLIATLNVSTAFTFPEIADTITLNRATIYSATVNIPLGMSFASVTRELSGTPTDLGRFSGRFSIDYVATDPDEELDEDGNLITPMTLRVGDDDKATLTVVVFVDDEPSFGGQTVSVQSYTENTSITNFDFAKSGREGITPLKYTLTDLSRLPGLNFDPDPLEARSERHTGERKWNF